MQVQINQLRAYQGGTGIKFYAGKILVWQGEPLKHSGWIITLADTFYTKNYRETGYTKNSDKGFRVGQSYSRKVN